MNAVRIFNEKEVDELIFLDIRASVEHRSPRLDVIRDIAGECFMPLAYGGGIRDLSQIERILNAGAEKVVLGTIMGVNPKLASEAAKRFGSQSIVASVDCKRTFFGSEGIYTNSGTTRVARDTVKYARYVQELGVGEIILNSIDHDGKQDGFDLDIIRRVSGSVSIPVVACGGAGKLEHLREAIENGASAVAAGSMFVFHGKYRAVLITYPEPAVLEELFRRNEG